MISVGHQKGGSVWFSAAVQDDQVLATCFSTKEPDLHRLLQRLPKGSEYEVQEEPNQFLSKVLGALEDVFEGKACEPFLFDVALNRLTSYAQSVLWCTGLVPVGYVTTYGAVARVAGGIARSVGQVEASNPVPLLVPCHRVVRSDLTLGGYGYGQQMKMQILEREHRGYKESKKLKVDNKELALFPSEWVKK